uniref:Uncharacterized LOC103365293 n=1 Tax=Stegastes partitus TaxID=144197 RepID=A0A3B5BES1_9TELE
MQSRPVTGVNSVFQSLFLPASTLLEDAKAEQPPCPHGDYRTEEGVCCNKCSPGFKLVEKCHATGQRSNCTACSDGEFTDQMNFFPNCKRCRRCQCKTTQPNPVSQSKACEPHQDTICRCMPGFYKFRIDSETSECRRCSTCGPDEPEKQTSEACEGVCVVVGKLVVLCLQKSLIYSEEPPESLKAVALICEMEPEVSNLPDCVPLEIRIPELIYMVLDLVPVLQVKQLVRCLGVKDMEIEQVELDHRSCREAHYQMLRVWAERGSRAGGGGGTLLLPLPRLQELLDNLRLMHLGRAAEELEAKYSVNTTVMFL